MGVGALGTSIGDMDDEWQRMANAAKGVGALCPRMYGKDDWEKVNDAVEEARKAYQESGNAGKHGTLAIAAAAARDLPYSACGRKYMLVAGMTKRSLYMVARGRMLGRFETREEES